MSCTIEATALLFCFFINLLSGAFKRMKLLQYSVMVIRLSKGVTRAVLKLLYTFIFLRQYLKMSHLILDNVLMCNFFFLLIAEYFLPSTARDMKSIADKSESAWQGRAFIFQVTAGLSHCSVPAGQILSVHRKKTNKKKTLIWFGHSTASSSLMGV